MMPLLSFFGEKEKEPDAQRHPALKLFRVNYVILNRHADPRGLELK